MKLSLALALAASLVAPYWAAAASPPKLPTTIAVTARAGHQTFVLFGVVEPVHGLTLRAAATGTVAALHVRPGDHARRGEVLARLAGPEYDAAVSSKRAAVAAAGKILASAAGELKESEARFPTFGSKADLERARAALASAQAGLAQSRARLAALEAAGKISSPTAGTITALLRGNGERVAAGDPILAIQPRGTLWLRADAYGENAARIALGMRGTFHPAAGGAPVAVRVSRLIPGAGQDGLGVGLLTSDVNPSWFSGASGSVELEGHAVVEPTVPDGCLVLDGGRWWVVEVVAGKLERRAVKPDFSHGGWTWIASGLKAGDHVVVADAYLVYHRELLKHYASED